MVHEVIVSDHRHLKCLRQGNQWIAQTNQSVAGSPQQAQTMLGLGDAKGHEWSDPATFRVLPPTQEACRTVSVSLGSWSSEDFTVSMSSLIEVRQDVVKASPYPKRCWHSQSRLNQGALVEKSSASFCRVCKYRGRVNYPWITWNRTTEVE